MDTKFDLNDIVLVPAEESNINSRSECSITSKFNLDEMLPIMASPMDTVVSVKNYQQYIKNGIIPCMPRGRYCNKPFPNISQCFIAFGLCEIEKSLKFYIKDIHRYKDNNAFYHYTNVLIDIANGHMSKLIPIIEEIKKRWPNMKLMVGNVANPETFVNLANAGADYVRISIGTGCFIPGQNVKLKKDNKNIEDINIGDEVLTHLNHYKKVINKFEYNINEEIYEINDIKCTKNHEFYVIEKQYENIINDKNLLEYAKWITAQDLDINKHLLIQY